jgi:hypothetical protein
LPSIRLESTRGEISPTGYLIVDYRVVRSQPARIGQIVGGSAEAVPWWARACQASSADSILGGSRNPSRPADHPRCANRA